MKKIKVILAAVITTVVVANTVSINVSAVSKEKEVRCV